MAVYVCSMKFMQENSFVFFVFSKRNLFHRSNTKKLSTIWCYHVATVHSFVFYLPNMHDCVGCSCDYFMMSGHTRVWSEILTNLQQGLGDGRLVVSFVCIFVSDMCFILFLGPQISTKSLLCMR